MLNDVENSQYVVKDRYEFFEAIQSDLLSNQKKVEDFFLPPKQRKIEKLESKRKGPEILSTQESSPRAKKFHIIFLLDENTKISDENYLESLNCITELVSDREQDQDIFSMFRSAVKTSEKNLPQEKMLKLLDEKFERRHDCTPRKISDLIHEIITFIKKENSKENFIPVVIFLTDGKMLNEKTKILNLCGSERKMIDNICKCFENLYKSLKGQEFYVFVSGVSSCNQDNLRKIAEAANGNQKVLETCKDRHDFFNQAKYVKTLPSIFRDLSSFSLMSKQERDRRKDEENLKNLQESEEQTKRVINHIYGALNQDLARKKQYSDKKYEYSLPNESYHQDMLAKKKKLQEDKEQTKTNLQFWETQLKNLEDARKANLLEINKFQNLQRPSIHINSYLNSETIHKCFEIFKELVQHVKESGFYIQKISEYFVFEMTAVIEKFQILKDDTRTVYDWLIGKNSSCLKLSTIFPQDPQNMKKICLQWLGAEFDQESFDMLFRSRSPKDLVNSDLNIFECEERLIQESVKIYETEVKAKQCIPVSEFRKRFIKFLTAFKNRLNEEKRLFEKEKHDQRLSEMLSIMDRHSEFVFIQLFSSFKK